MKKLAIVFGTRPEIIKLSEIMLLAKKARGIDARIIHTGQHYDYNMSQQFLEELGLPKIDANLEVGSGTHAQTTGKAMIALEEWMMREKPDVVVAEGDTNTVLAAALVAVKLHIPFAHVEAGIRSFWRGMPEEINRVLADQAADYCFAPTKIAVGNLRKEGIAAGKIHLTGNTIVEATQRGLKLAGKKATAMKKLGLKKGGFVLATAHREENVDSRARFSALISALSKLPLPVIYPIHPRSRRRLEEFGLRPGRNIRLIEPLGYFDFLQLCANSKFIITDSGGIQEECTVYKRPILIARDNTERPEILGRFGELVGCDEKKMLSASKKLLASYDAKLARLRKLPSPYGDGKASERIMRILVG